VPKHDRILSVLDGDETGHLVHGLPVCALSAFVTHISLSSCQADHEVPSFTPEFGLWFWPPPLFLCASILTQIMLVVVLRESPC
jgi:hypothetical protein